MIDVVKTWIHDLNDEDRKKDVWATQAAWLITATDVQG